MWQVAHVTRIPQHEASRREPSSTSSSLVRSCGGSHVSTVRVSSQIFFKLRIKCHCLPYRGEKSPESLSQSRSREKALRNPHILVRSSSPFWFVCPLRGQPIGPSVSIRLSQLLSSRAETFSMPSLPPANTQSGMPAGCYTTWPAPSNTCIA